MTKVYIDEVTASPPDTALGDLVAVLAFERGIAPRVGHVEPVQCEWCAEAGALTTIRVYGQPRPEVAMPVELVEVCGMCAPSVIRRAVAEADVWSDDLVIEVAG